MRAPGESAAATRVERSYAAAWLNARDNARRVSSPITG